MKIVRPCTILTNNNDAKAYPSYGERFKQLRLIKYKFIKSLILAQDERWRRA